MNIQLILTILFGALGIAAVAVGVYFLRKTPPQKVLGWVLVGVGAVAILGAVFSTGFMLVNANQSTNRPEVPESAEVLACSVDQLNYWMENNGALKDDTDCKMPNGTMLSEKVFATIQDSEDELPEGYVNVTGLTPDNIADMCFDGAFTNRTQWEELCGGNIPQVTDLEDSCSGTYSGFAYDVPVGETKTFEVAGGTLTVTCGTPNDTTTSFEADVIDNGGNPIIETILPQSGCMSWTAFKALADGKGTYELIDVLDAQTMKKDHPKAEGAWNVTDVSVVWTGLYVDDTTLGGTTTPITVDGKTGVWLVDGPVTVPTASGEICITGFDGTMPSTLGVDPNRNGGTIQVPNACVPTADVVALFNANKTTDPNAIYRGLDEIADNNPDARIRFGGTANVIALNTKTLVWSQTGTAFGALLELDRFESKSIWLATTNTTLNMTYPFSGLNLCTPLNPEADFPWWGN